VVECKEACKVTLLVSYVTHNASWKPSYDIRMFTSEDMLKVKSLLACRARGMWVVIYSCDR
jgi:hypothetical protein